MFAQSAFAGIDVAKTQLAHRRSSVKRVKTTGVSNALKEPERVLIMPRRALDRQKPRTQNPRFHGQKYQKIPPSGDFCSCSTLPSLHTQEPPTASHHITAIPVVSCASWSSRPSRLIRGPGVCTLLRRVAGLVTRHAPPPPLIGRDAIVKGGATRGSQSRRPSLVTARRDASLHVIRHSPLVT